MTTSLRSLGLLVLVLLAVSSFGMPTRFTVSRKSAEFPATQAAEACELVSNGLITWSPAEIECPVCQTKNIFLVWGSYGNYIYQYASKYQLIFWPHTDSPTWYSCKKCRFTAFMGSFKEVPKDKLEDLRKMLEGVKLPAQKTRSDKESMEHPPYLEIPTSERLVVVEKVQRLLGETSDDYWNHFYRVMGYHFSADKKQAEADEARHKALAITERLLLDKANDGRRKELLYISGAMRHFLRDDVNAIKDLENAKKLEYADSDLKAEQNKNYDNYLSSLIDEYLEMLHKGKGPREQAIARAN